MARHLDRSAELRSRDVIRGDGPNPFMPASKAKRLMRLFGYMPPLFPEDPRASFRARFAIPAGDPLLDAIAATELGDWPE